MMLPQLQTSISIVRPDFLQGEEKLLLLLQGLVLLQLEENGTGNIINLPFCLSLFMLIGHEFFPFMWHALVVKEYTSIKI